MKIPELKKGNIIYGENIKAIYVGNGEAIAFKDLDIMKINPTDKIRIKKIKKDIFSDGFIYEREEKGLSKRAISCFKKLKERGVIKFDCDDDWMLFYSGNMIKDIMLINCFDDEEIIRELKKLKPGTYKIDDIIKKAENDNKNERTSKKGN